MRVLLALLSGGLALGVGVEQRAENHIARLEHLLKAGAVGGQHL